MFGPPGPTWQGTNPRPGRFVRIRDLPGAPTFLSARAGFRARADKNVGAPILPSPGSAQSRMRTVVFVFLPSPPEAAGRSRRPRDGWQKDKPKDRAERGWATPWLSVPALLTRIASRGHPNRAKRMECAQLAAAFGRGRSVPMAACLVKAAASCTHSIRWRAVYAFEARPGPEGVATVEFAPCQRQTSHRSGGRTGSSLMLRPGGPPRLHTMDTVLLRPQTLGNRAGMGF